MIVYYAKIVPFILKFESISRKTWLQNGKSSDHSKWSGRLTDSHDFYQTLIRSASGLYILSPGCTLKAL